MSLLRLHVCNEDGSCEIVQTPKVTYTGGVNAEISVWDVDEWMESIRLAQDRVEEYDNRRDE